MKAANGDFANAAGRMSAFWFLFRHLAEQAQLVHIRPAIRHSHPDRRLSPLEEQVECLVQSQQGREMIFRRLL